jgi:decaprenylphospho-beta-D-ribofuranose 2-oxidase
MTMVMNWGNFPKVDAEIIRFRETNELLRHLETDKTVIARGLGRCYGDSSLNRNIVSTLKYNRILHFDHSTGYMSCESGVTLQEILEICISKGWFLPVTPGTKYVTVGGAIASDIHGKNHHKDGSFSNHLISIDMLLADGSILSCSPDENSELFWSTCGGMGLTGIILRAAFSLKRIETAYMTQHVIRAKDLSHLIQLSETYAHCSYSVAWIDCLRRGKNMGRGILITGEHASTEVLNDRFATTAFFDLPQKKRITLPFYFPAGMINSISVRAFNEIYFRRQSIGTAPSLVDYDTFFYPLDAINQWNRIYGRRGFIQYQFVLPITNSGTGLTEIVSEISKAGMGAFLAVLKLFGVQDHFIAFPIEGYTLAVDFPVSKNLFSFLDKLDRLVLKYGGRLYLTKDARMKREVFLHGYEHASDFIAIKNKYDPHGKFQSLQSIRLGI